MKYELTLNSYKDSLIELLGALIQIKSVSGEKGEREISNFIFNFLEAICMLASTMLKED